MAIIIDTTLDWTRRIADFTLELESPNDNGTGMSFNDILSLADEIRDHEYAGASDR